MKRFKDNGEKGTSSKEIDVTIIKMFEKEKIILQ